MQLLTTENLYTVSGGESTTLHVTKQISIEGISPVCLKTFVSSAQIANLSKKQFLLNILNACELSELDLLADRLDEANALSIQLV
jgi:hypothetical protein